MPEVQRTINEEIVSHTFTTNPVSSNGVDFTNIVYIIPLTGNSGAGLTTIDLGEHNSYYFVCTSAADLLIANLTTAGSFSALTIQAVSQYFAQIPRPSKLFIIAVDTANSDTASTMLTAYEVINENYSAVVTQDRTINGIAAIGTTLNGFTRKKLLLAQTDATAIKSDNATFLATNLGTAYAYPKFTSILVCADSTDNILGYAGSLLAGDIAVKCPPSDLLIESGVVSNYDATTRANIRANHANYYMLAGKIGRVREGRTLNGKFTYIALTTMWAVQDLQTRVLDDSNNGVAAKNKFPLNEEGQQRLIAIHEMHFDAGFKAGHYDNTKPSEVYSPDISDADRESGTLRTIGSVWLKLSAIKFVMTTGAN